MNDYRIRILPRVMAHAGRVRDAMKFLCCKDYMQERLNTLGVLEGTSLILSDIEEIINETSNDLQTSEIAHLVDSCSEEIRAYIQCALNISKNTEDSNTCLDGITRKSHTEAGMAFHLLALLKGNMGTSEAEIDFLTEGLKLKRLGLGKDGNSTNRFLFQTHYTVWG